MEAQAGAGYVDDIFDTKASFDKSFPSWFPIIPFFPPLQVKLKAVVTQVIIQLFT